MQEPLRTEDSLISTVLESQVSLGQKLQKAREDKKIALEDVCDFLKIRRFFLESIEKGQFDKLPGTVYTVGFIRSYAQYLGVDVGQEIEYIFSFSNPEEQKTPKQSYVLNQTSHSVSPKVLVASIALLMAFGGVFIYGKYFYFNKDSALSKSVDDAFLQTNVNKENLAAIPHNSSGQTSLSLSASRQTWVKITDADGKLVVARLVKPGDIYEIDTKEGYHLTTADAGALKFSINQDVFSLSQLEPGTLLENMPIDPNSLKTMTQSANQDFSMKDTQ